MKFFHSNILALCALITPHSNAFVSNSQKRFGISPTALASTRDDVARNVRSGISGVNTRSRGGSITGPNLTTARPVPSGPVPAPDSQQVTVGQSADVSPFTNPRTTEDIFQDLTPRQIQGSSLKVCHFSEIVERVSVYLKTTGRPLNADVELWHGPDHTPQKMSVYLEDGSKYPFRAIVESPGSSSNTVAIRNTGSIEYPIIAGLEVDMSGENLAPSKVLINHPKSECQPVQGGAIYTKPFQPAVQSVQVALKSDGRPINARIELLQGPNNNKSVMDVYSEDGSERPFYLIVDTPGEGNVIRVVNTSSVEFPLLAAIEPYLIDERIADGSLNWY
jgi:hypothetical protein